MEEALPSTRDMVDSSNRHGGNGRLEFYLLSIRFIIIAIVSKSFLKTMVS